MTPGICPPYFSIRDRKLHPGVLGLFHSLPFRLRFDRFQAEVRMEGVQKTFPERDYSLCAYAEE